MTRPGSTKVSSGEHAPQRIQGDDVIKGLIPAADAGEGLGRGTQLSGGIAKVNCGGEEPHDGEDRVLGGDKRAARPPRVGSTKHARPSTTGVTADSLPRFLAASEVPAGGVAWRGGRGLGGDVRVNHLRAWGRGRVGGGPGRGRGAGRRPASPAGAGSSRGPGARALAQPTPV